MLRFGSLLGAGLVLASLLAHGSASAQGYYYPPPPPTYAPPPSVGAPSNVVTYPDGSVVADGGKPNFKKLQAIRLEQSR